MILHSWGQVSKAEEEERSPCGKGHSGEAVDTNIDTKDAGT
jgi:hypothetical protein